MRKHVAGGATAKGNDRTARMGTGPIPKLVLEFAIPSIVGMLVNGAYNVIDSIFLGQAMGEIGLSVATAAMPLMTIFMALGMLIGNGGNALAALRLGEGNKQAAEKSLGNTVCLGIIIAVVVAIIACIPPCMEALLSLSSATPEIHDYTYSFIQIVAFGVIFQIIGMGVNNFIRTAARQTALAYHGYRHVFLHHSELPVCVGFWMGRCGQRAGNRARSGCFLRLCIVVLPVHQERCI